MQVGFEITAKSAAVKRSAASLEITGPNPISGLASLEFLMQPARVVWGKEKEEKGKQSGKTVTTGYVFAGNYDAFHLWVEQGMQGFRLYEAGKPMDFLPVKAKKIAKARKAVRQYIVLPLSLEQ